MEAVAEYYIEPISGLVLQLNKLGRIIGQFVPSEVFKDDDNDCNS